MYKLAVKYDGRQISSLDKKIEQIVGRASWSSGVGFGVREICFGFDTKTEAQVAEMRVHAVYPRFSYDVAKMQK